MIALIGVAGIAHGAVIASIDRANVELNESFTLKITVDTAIVMVINADQMRTALFDTGGLAETMKPGGIVPKQFEPPLALQSVPGSWAAATEATSVERTRTGTSR